MPMDQVPWSQVVPCIVILGVFTIVFGFFAILRYLKYRETLALAEKGLLHAEPPRGNGKNTLRWGIAITAVGLALDIGLLPVALSYPHSEPVILVGLIPTFFGIGQIIIYLLTREGKPQGPPAA